MGEHIPPKAGRIRWYHIGGFLILSVLLGFIVQLFVSYPSIADIYRPATLTIERMERKEVRHGKRTIILDFYFGKYLAYDMRFPTSFATDTGIYVVGDTVRVLYDPERPAMHVIYAPRSGAVHLPRGSAFRISRSTTRTSSGCSTVSMRQIGSEASES